jgi:hypothetical protein
MWVAPKDQPSPNGATRAGTGHVSVTTTERQTLPA